MTMWRNRWARGAALWTMWVVVGLLGGRPASAQNVGTVTGLVRDAQGLIVPGATVVIENRISKVTQSTDSGMDGRYTLANIAFGDIVGLETLRLGMRSDTFHLYNTSGTDYATPHTSRAPFDHPDRRSTSGLITNRNRQPRAA